MFLAFLGFFSCSTMTTTTTVVVAAASATRVKELKVIAVLVLRARILLFYLDHFKLMF